MASDSFGNDGIRPWLAIRTDLREMHRLVWEAIGGPGSWWTGAQRVAIARHARIALDCDLCAERNAALSPYSVDRGHEPDGPLDAVTVDVVHRVITDAVRLTETWVQSLADHGVSEGHYVELLGAALLAFDLDEFQRALGCPLDQLPAPRLGEPDCYQPPGLVKGLGWVRVVDPAAAGPDEVDLFRGARTGKVLASLSQVPDIMRLARRLNEIQYVPTERVTDLMDDAGREIDRSLMELVASEVSALNGCLYCATAHSSLFDASGSVRSVEERDHTEAAVALRRLVEAAVTRSSDLGDARREVATMLGPKALVDVVAIISTFQRMSRIADATGIRSEGDPLAQR